MTVGIIPEPPPSLPRGLLVRPLALVALVGGVLLTFDAQWAFLRPGADLGIAAALLGFAYVPFVWAIPILWRVGKSPAWMARVGALLVAAFLVGSTYLGLQDAFVVNRTPTSGVVFFLLPAGQLVVLAILTGLVWWAGSSARAEDRSGAEALAAG